MSKPIDVRPWVSVITVVYNGADSIAITIESTLAQDYPHVEIVVVDGGSRDATATLVRQYGNRVDQFVSEPDRGVYDAMNKAVALASGEYLLFMNCGDFFAGRDALSQAMSQLVPGSEQALFGRWVRRSPGKRDALASPCLANATFNHQATVYSRSIHKWHGNYLCLPGLTTADYLFFASLIYSGATDCRTSDVIIASIDVTGISAGQQTYAQRNTIDFLCGKLGKASLVGRLLAHPTYFHAKRILRRLQWLR